MRLARICQAVALALVAALLGWLAVGRGAQALPPAGTDRLPVVATANVTSRLGTENVVFTGWAEIAREAPHDEGGVDVVDFEVVSMDLRGASSIGAVTVAESATAVSTGEIRSLQAGQDFPASSFMDVFMVVTVPANPTPTLELHNQAAMRLQPMTGSQVVTLNAWPPLGVTYRLDPIYSVDNDGDTQIDEDTADDDGDGAYDEDPPGGGNQDTDALTDEDPPLAQCTVPVCDEDGDGSMDEDPSCVPLFSPPPANSNLKAGFCVRDLSLQVAPELPSFSVARGGPSNIHPADILSLGPPPLQPGAPTPTPTAPPPPTPVDVSGNDNFANGWVVPGLPFTGTQTTAGSTMEGGEPTTLANCPLGISTPIGATVWYRFTPSVAGTVTADTDGSDFDTVLAAYTGGAVGSLTRVACDDDTLFPQSRIAFPVAAGTLYSLQVGGFVNATGNLTLNLSAGGAIAPDETAPFVRIPCLSLGLTADGCDVPGATDDLDALAYGDDFPADASPSVNFSVAPGAEGVLGSAVRAQRNCPAPEPQGDEFRSTFNNSNTLFLDGNGPIGACTSAFPLGLIEGATSRDDLDALDEKDTSFVDPDEDGVPDNPVYFSLESASPSLTTFGFSAADILKTVDGNAPSVYAAAPALGLETGDDVDGLCLQEDGNGVYDQADTLVFSLASGSPTLAQIGAGPADILAPGSPNPTVLQNEGTMGLLPADDLDAMKCQALALKDPVGDTDGDTIPNGTDPDDDNDGCTDSQELGADPTLGGQRDPHNFWDVMDVFTGSPLARDGSISAGDVAGVVGRFGANDGGPGTFDRNSNPLSMPSPPVQPSGARANYHPAYDRGGGTPGGSPWNLNPPDGAITSGDIAAAVAQFGHSCL
ncbi:MAG: flexitail domain-containing putative surface protein [Dehalococcoidia bacterium]